MNSELHFATRGTGTPLLALHGWSCDHRLMTGWLEPAVAGRTGWRRLYPDLPGMGKSPAASVASSDDVLDAVDAFVAEHLGDEPFALVGESYGGYLARALTSRRREQVLGLALMCPIGVEVRRERRDRPPLRVLESEPGLTDGVDPEETADFEELAVLRNRRTLARFRAEVAPGLKAADSDALDRIFRRWELAEPPESGAPFDRPALIVTGRQDAAVGYAEQFALLPHYPRASYVTLDRAGHNAHIEQPELVEALTRDWLDRVRNARG